MNDRHNEINDDEIRVISSSGERRTGSRKKTMVILAAVALVVLAVIALIIFRPAEPAEDTEAVELPAIEKTADVMAGVIPDEIAGIKGFASVRDTVVDGIGLTILTPRHTTPVLVVGEEALRDTTAVLVAQAADVRADNGKIAGAYVVKGELLSRGEAKAGFCSIVNGEIVVGVADATPMLEQALMSEGYFFRQFPLVVGGQVVENKPKGRALRKALAEIDGEICVVLSRERLTFHDFSNALIDAGVRNAIYLVGSNAAGFYVDEDGHRQTFGTIGDTESRWENINYIVWR